MCLDVKTPSNQVDLFDCKKGDNDQFWSYV